MKKYKTLATITFVFYIILLIWIIVFKLDFCIEDVYRIRSFNFIPFRNTGGIGDIMDNIILFVPFGLFMRMKNKKHFLINVFITLGTSIVFEVTQYITALGVCDISDVITNTAGGMLGYGATSLIYRIFNKNEDKITRILTIISSVGIFCIAAFILFLGVVTLLSEVTSGV